MKIVGCDFHPSYQQVAVFDTFTGEVEELKLMHGDGEAERFYRELEAPALIGMESVGNSLWFEQLVESLGHQLWIGDAAQIRASYVRKQKTDKRDAGHILKLLVENRFPRIWVPNQQQRDLRQLLVHRHKSGAGADADEDRVAAPGAESGSTEKTPAMERSGEG